MDGTKNILDLATCTKHRFLYISSGAIYGSQPPELNAFTEGWLGGPCLADQVQLMAKLSVQLNIYVRS